MIDSLSKAGRRIAGFFGDPDLGIKESLLKRPEIKESVFSFDTLASILPYQSYDEESGLFINDDSLGFTIEMPPLVGGDETAQREFKGLFEEILEEGSSIQCLLLPSLAIFNFTLFVALHG